MERIEALTEQQARDAMESEDRTEKLGSEIVSLREDIEKVCGNMALCAHVNWVKNVGGNNSSPLPILSWVKHHDCHFPCFSIVCDLSVKWCSFRSLCTLSIHLSLGLPRGILPSNLHFCFPPAIFLSSIIVRSHRERQVVIIVIRVN